MCNLQFTLTLTHREKVMETAEKRSEGGKGWSPQMRGTKALEARAPSLDVESLPS